MPNPRKAFANNSPGAWYVDDQCIICGLCENVAPRLFRLADDAMNYQIYQQPLTSEDLEAAENARERCPAEAIGNDRTVLSPLPV